MAILVLVLCLWPFAFGVIGVVSPARFRAIVRNFATPFGLYVGAAFRVVLGAALVAVHASSRDPEFVQVLGILLIVGGLTVPFFGLARLRRMVDWFLESGPAVVRGWAVLAIAFSLLLAYEVSFGSLA
ncbi:MAG: hypothetical protein ACR2PQ_03770 [Myxococcota bacterium]